MQLLFYNTDDIIIIKLRYAKIIDSFALSFDFHAYYRVVPKLTKQN